MFGRSAYVKGFDDPLAPLPGYLDRAPLRFFPLAWANDAGGVVLGVQARTSYLGDVRQATVRFGLPAVKAWNKGGTARRRDPGSLYVRVRNPILWGRPRYGMGIEAFLGEGRGFFALGGERDVSRLPSSGPRRFVRAGVTLSSIYDPTYLAPGRWTPQNRGSAEVSLGMRETRSRGTWRLGLSWGLDTNDHVFMRGTFDGVLTTAPRSPWRGSLRLFVGGALGRYLGHWAGMETPRERQFFLAGGGPYAALGNPWVRSAGAPLDLNGWVPGGGALVGYHPGVALAQVAGLSGSLATPARSARLKGTHVEARVRLFAGASMGATPTLVDPPVTLASVVWSDFGRWRHLYGSAGTGLELGVAGAPLRLRLDVPMFVADPDLAAAGRSGRLAFRYAVSVVAGR